MITVFVIIISIIISSSSGSIKKAVLVFFCSLAGDGDAKGTPTTSTWPRHHDPHKNQLKADQKAKTIHFPRACETGQGSEDWFTQTWGRRNRAAALKKTKAHKACAQTKHRAIETSWKPTGGTLHVPNCPERRGRPGDVARSQKELRLS